MATTVIHDVDPEVYLDRQRRMQHARGVFDGVMKPQEMLAVLSEVQPLDGKLHVGGRYRFRVLGGTPVFTHKHGVDEAGQEFALDLPDVPQPEWQEREGLYRGRGAGAWSGSHFFQLDDGQVAALADIDILRLEAVA